MNQGDCWCLCRVQSSREILFFCVYFYIILFCKRTTLENHEGIMFVRVFRKVPVSGRLEDRGH